MAKRKGAVARGTETAPSKGRTRRKGPEAPPGGRAAGELAEKDLKGVAGGLHHASDE